MNVFYTEDALNHQHAYVALGVFDGVHRAHAELITSCLRAAQQAGKPCFVYTYANQTHPQKDEKAGGALTTLEEKLERLDTLDVPNVVVLTFTPEYKSTPPIDFLKQLCREGRVEAIFCGRDYRFGFHGQGKIDLMDEEQKALGYTLHAIDDIILDGAPISSTRVRAAIAEGNCAYAHQLLGYPYTVQVQDIEQDVGFWPQGKAVLPDAVYQCRDAQGPCRIRLQGRKVLWLDRTPEQCAPQRVQFLQKIEAL